MVLSGVSFAKSNRKATVSSLGSSGISLDIATLRSCHSAQTRQAPRNGLVAYAAPPGAFAIRDMKASNMPDSS